MKQITLVRHMLVAGLLLFAGTYAAVSHAEFSLQQFAELPTQELLSSYPADTEQVLSTYADHWAAGDVGQAVYYAAHAPGTHDAAIKQWTFERLSGLPTPFYFLLSHRTFAEDPDAAVFWLLVAGVNAYYDAARCPGGSGEEVALLFSLNRRAIVHKELVRQRGELAPVLQRAVNWLRRNPVPPAPDYLCQRPVPSEAAERKRAEAVEQLEVMLVDGGVPQASPRLRRLVFAAMDVRQDLLLTRLTLENMAGAERARNTLVAQWAASVSDAALKEHLALAYLKFWNEPVAQAVLDFHSTKLGAKLVQRAIDEHLGLVSDSTLLSEAEAAALDVAMRTPELRRMQEMQDSVLEYQGHLLRMAAGDPSP